MICQEKKLIRAYYEALMSLKSWLKSLKIVFSEIVLLQVNDFLMIF